MKKIVIVVVVLVLALAVAPWGVGKVAEKRLNHGLDKLVEAAPYLKVVERKWTRGWFKSEQVVTFEAFGPWIDAMNPKAIEDGHEEGSAAAEGGERRQSEARGRARRVDRSPDAVPRSADAPTLPSAGRKHE